MVQNYTVWVEKKAYPVVVSDEREALLAAKAAGRGFVGLYPLGENGGGSPVSYSQLPAHPQGSYILLRLLI